MRSESAFDVAAAGRKYLEQYGDPIVTNTYLKIVIAVLSLVSLGLLVLLYRAQDHAAHLMPLVIRVDEIGSAQVVRYEDFRSIPVEKVSKYYLARWASSYYGRNHATLQRDFAESLHYLSNDQQGATLQAVKKAKTLETFLLDQSQPNVDIEIKQVVLEDLRQPPYRARIEFEKVFTAPSDHQELKRERWTANVVYSFRDSVPNDMLLVNPLGLAITYFREDQAFGS